MAVAGTAQAPMSAIAGEYYQDCLLGGSEPLLDTGTPPLEPLPEADGGESWEGSRAEPVDEPQNAAGNGSLPATPAGTGPLTPASLPLPPQSGPSRPTLVLDLDGTLIASEELNSASSTYAWNPNARTPDYVAIGRRVWLRPGVKEFLAAVRPHFEVVLFTAATQNWAAAAVDQLDPAGLIFDVMLHRDHTTSDLLWDYVKDLSRLGRDLSRTVIVDDNPLMFMYQPDNALHIAAYEAAAAGGPDNVLGQVSEVLINQVVPSADVREVLGPLATAKSVITSTLPSAAPAAPPPAAAAAATVDYTPGAGVAAPQSDWDHLDDSDDEEEADEDGDGSLASGMDSDSTSRQSGSSWSAGSDREDRGGQGLDSDEDEELQGGCGFTAATEEALLEEEGGEGDGSEDMEEEAFACGRGALGDSCAAHGNGVGGAAAVAAAETDDLEAFMCEAIPDYDASPYDGQYDSDLEYDDSPCAAVGAGGAAADGAEQQQEEEQAVPESTAAASAAAGTSSHSAGGVAGGSGPSSCRDLYCGGLGAGIVDAFCATCGAITGCMCVDSFGMGVGMSGDLGGMSFQLHHQQQQPQDQQQQEDGKGSCVVTVPASATAGARAEGSAGDSAAGTVDAAQCGGSSSPVPGGMVLFSELQPGSCGQEGAVVDTAAAVLQPCVGTKRLREEDDEQERQHEQEAACGDAAAAGEACGAAGRCAKPRLEG